MAQWLCVAILHTIVFCFSIPCSSIIRNLIRKHLFIDGATYKQKRAVNREEKKGKEEREREKWQGQKGPASLVR